MEVEGVPGTSSVGDGKTNGGATVVSLFIFAVPLAISLRAVVVCLGHAGARPASGNALHDLQIF